MWLNDCIIKDPSQLELLIFGSEAAYSAAKLDRDRNSQAILDIGPTFTIAEELFEVLDSDQCKSIIASLGAGIVFPGREVEGGSFNIANLRYHKVIIVSEMCEAGRDFRIEVLRFFFTYMRPLIVYGHIFVLERSLEQGFTQQEFVEHVLDPVTRRLRVIEGADTLEAVLSRLD